MKEQQLSNTDSLKPLSSKHHRASAWQEIQEEHCLSFIEEEMVEAVTGHAGGVVPFHA